jgi:hypothetical protein
MIREAMGAVLGGLLQKHSELGWGESFCNRGIQFLVKSQVAIGHEAGANGRRFVEHSFAVLAQFARRALFFIITWDESTKLMVQEQR